MQFDRNVGFEWGNCHPQNFSNDLGATSRHEAFNDFAQININTKPWSYYNQIELMCSVSWLANNSSYSQQEADCGGFEQPADVGSEGKEQL